MNELLKKICSYSYAGIFLSIALTSTLHSNKVLGDEHKHDLLGLYERALGYDAELSVATAEFQSALPAESLARSNVRPQLSIGYRAAINDVNNDFRGSFTDQGPNLSLRQTIYNKVSLATIKEAKASTSQARSQLNEQQQELILRVTEAYFNVLQAESELAFRRSELEAIARQKEQNERRFDVGLVAITDVKDAQAQFDLATAQEIAAANSLATAQEALSLIAGVHTLNLAQLDEKAPLLQPTPANSEQWVEIAKTNNIALKTTEFAVKSAKAELIGSRAERFPTLDLVGLASSNTSSVGLRDDSEFGELRLELNLPLLGGGRTNATIRQSKARLKASRQQHELQRRVTVQQTRDAYRNVVAIIAQANALQKALESTQKSLEAQEAGFAEGLLTSLEVLRSLRDTFQAQTDYISARYQYIVNIMTLKRFAGTLSEEDLREVNNWLQ